MGNTENSIEVSAVVDGVPSAYDRYAINPLSLERSGMILAIYHGDGTEYDTDDGRLRTAPSAQGDPQNRDHYTHEKKGKYRV